MLDKQSKGIIASLLAATNCLVAVPTLFCGCHGSVAYCGLSADADAVLSEVNHKAVIATVARGRNRLVALHHIDKENKQQQQKDKNNNKDGEEEEQQKFGGGMAP